MPTLSPHPPIVTPSPIEKIHTPDHPLKSVGSIINSPHPTSDAKCEGGNPSSAPTVATLKRPILILKEYETTLNEEEHSLDLLYDYSTLDAW